MKRLPLGISNYEKIVEGDFYYFDKSNYIPIVENRSNFVMLARPRRMGKSLFSSMLASYYDINNKDRFQKLFGNLWIGSHPTPEANKYLVLQFDFSKVERDIDELRHNFGKYVKGRVWDYFSRYKEYYSQDQIDHALSYDSPVNLINALIDASRFNKLYTYLIIDEYDNFTNSVLAARGVEEHRKITHGMGFYRNFFQSFKDAFDRIYMTGVTPVTYDDLTSGFSIATLVALERRFNQIVGVTETELRTMIDYYREQGLIQRDTDTIVAEMKPWYNNFCFSSRCYGEEDSIYNTNMVMNYMGKITEEDITPEVMIDRSARTDTNKLDYLILTEELRNKEHRIETIEEICAKGYTTGDVEPQFSAIDAGDDENFKSILFYYGTLTYGGWDESGDTILKVTNRTMADLYLGYMKRIAKEQGLNVDKLQQELNKTIEKAAVQGDWQPMADAIGELYKKYSSVRNSIGGEADVQGFLRGMLCLNKYFALWPELELGGGYCDILLISKDAPNCPTKHSYLIELKYMKKDEGSLELVEDEAAKQLRRYLTDTRLAETGLLQGTELTPLCLVFQNQTLISKKVIEL